MCMIKNRWVIKSPLFLISSDGLGRGRKNPFVLWEEKNFSFRKSGTRTPHTSAMALPPLHIARIMHKVFKMSMPELIYNPNKAMRFFAKPLINMKIQMRLNHELKLDLCLKWWKYLTHINIRQCLIARSVAWPPPYSNVYDGTNSCGFEPGHSSNYQCIFFKRMII